MLGLFKKKSLLTDDEFFFLIDTYKWLLKHYGGDDFYKNTPLVLPTKEFFPDLNTKNFTPENLFKNVKKHASMSEWECELVEQEEDPERLLSPGVLVQGDEHSPLGTFSVNENDKVIITYNPKSGSDQLVATFAHELAHYLTAGCEEEPPGGWDNWEFATDVAAVFLGYGIFMANTAFHFSQYSDGEYQGWHMNRSGYITEAEFSYALGMFLKLKDIDPEIAYPFLDDSVKGHVKRSLKELETSESFKELTQVK